MRKSSSLVEGFTAPEGRSHGGDTFETLAGKLHGFLASPLLFDLHIVEDEQGEEVAVFGDLLLVHDESQLLD